MARPTRDPAGRFTGSIGDGKTPVPSPAVPGRSVSVVSPGPATGDYHRMHARFRAEVEVGTVAPYDGEVSRDTGEQARRHYRTQVTPGVRDAVARFVFRNGQCHSMAAALAERTGWPVIVLIDRTSSRGGQVEDEVRHIYVEAPNGMWVDIDGENEPAIVMEETEAAVTGSGGRRTTPLIVRTDATGARGLATRGGSARLGLDCEVPMLPTCLPVARSLVDEVLTDVDS